MRFSLRTLLMAMLLGGLMLALPFMNRGPEPTGQSWGYKNVDVMTVIARDPDQVRRMRWLLAIALAGSLAAVGISLYADNRRP